MKPQRELAAIILAAGKGTRMKSGKTNKVALTLRGKPLIQYVVNILEKMSFDQIVVVVGFAKQSVKDALQNSKVLFVEQKKQTGTASAVELAIPVLKNSITDILVVYGDDSHFYNKAIITGLINAHFKSGSKITFMTMELENPSGLGRVVRDDYGDVVSVVEEKDADEKIKKIHEINSACYVFNVNFLKKYIRKVQKSEATGEYYLTKLIDIAVENDEPINTFKTEKISWRGVNTINELIEAEKIYKNLIG